MSKTLTVAVIKRVFKRHGNDFEQALQDPELIEAFLNSKQKAVYQTYFSKVTGKLYSRWEPHIGKRKCFSKDQLEGRTKEWVETLTEGQCIDLAKETMRIAHETQSLSHIVCI